MIEKMQFINITGPKNDIDRVVNVYLNKYEIHLENALSELDNVKDLRPFLDVNPYKDVLSKASEMQKKIKTSIPYLRKLLTIHQAEDIITNLSAEISTLNAQKQE